MTRGVLTTWTSGTALEREYRAADRATSRVPPPDAPFELAAHDPRAIARARRTWLDRMVDEHASASVFARIAIDLAEASAPIDVVAVSLRMAHDEIRHAEICGEVVRALGARPERTRDTRAPDVARHPGACPVERATRNVLVASCLSESASVAYFVAALERVTDPFLRGQIRRLLADEVLHARFGFMWLEVVSPWLAERPAIRASIGRYLRHAFAVVERERCGPTLRAATLADEPFGTVAGEAWREVFASTMADAVVPGLERAGIPAADAWARRSLT